MTLQEAINKITATPKWYAGKMKQSTASSTIRNIKAGTAKPETVKSFMGLFGYEVERELLWKRK